MAPGVRYDAALADAARRLAPIADSSRLEAELLLAHALGRDRSHLRAWPERTLDSDAQAAYEDLLARRLSGTPLAYLTGEREFWSLRLHVAPGVLIPRPETERLVEQALNRLPAEHPPCLADLGTGSGAIALALASERPDARIVATDRSETALEIARGNARRLNLPVEFRAGDWLDALPADARYNLIVSNPPYIAEGDPHLARGDLPAEPPEALASGRDGLDAIRRIVADAPSRLRPGGWLLLEHGFDQGAAVRALLEDAGLADVATLRDLENRERVSEARRPA